MKLQKYTKLQSTTNESPEIRKAGEFRLLDHVMLLQATALIMFTCTPWKRYELLIIGLVTVLSINFCYHSNEKECSDIDGLAKKIN